MTKMDQMLDHLDAHPEATDGELSDLLQMDRRNIRTYLQRAKQQGRMTERFNGETRSITVHSPDQPAASNFKRDMYEHMLEMFIVDFDNAATFDDRLAIGTVLLRIVEKL